LQRCEAVRGVEEQQRGVVAGCSGMAGVGLWRVQKHWCGKAGDYDGKKK